MPQKTKIVLASLALHMLQTNPALFSNFHQSPSCVANVFWSQFCNFDSSFEVLLKGHSEFPPPIQGCHVSQHSTEHCAHGRPLHRDHSRSAKEGIRGRCIWFRKQIESLVINEKWATNETLTHNQKVWWACLPILRCHYQWCSVPFINYIQQYISSQDQCSSNYVAPIHYWFNQRIFTHAKSARARSPNPSTTTLKVNIDVWPPQQQLNSFIISAPWTKVWAENVWHFKLKSITSFYRHQW